jgi:hypothetical protein
LAANEHHFWEFSIVQRKHAGETCLK